MGQERIMSIKLAVPTTGSKVHGEYVAVGINLNLPRLLALHWVRRTHAVQAATRGVLPAKGNGDDTLSRPVLLQELRQGLSSSVGQGPFVVQTNRRQRQH